MFRVYNDSMIRYSSRLQHYNISAATLSLGKLSSRYDTFLLICLKRFNYRPNSVQIWFVGNTFKNVGLLGYYFTELYVLETNSRAISKIVCTNAFTLNYLLRCPSKKLNPKWLLFKGCYECVHFALTSRSCILKQICSSQWIIFNFRINFDVACNMDFQMYPVDEQDCVIKFESYGLQNKQVIFILC